MRILCRLIWSGFFGLLRSRSALAAENLVLRQQINVLRRTAPRRLSFNCLDRFIFVGLYRLFPEFREALAIVKPDTVIEQLAAGGNRVLAVATGSSRETLRLAGLPATR